MVQRGMGIASATVMSDLLVIDDDPVIAELLVSVLAEGGHETTTAPQLELAPRRNFDLVITDLFSGDAYDPGVAREWGARVRERYPDTPVVVCTAHSAARDAAALSADAVCAKPFEVDSLLALVRLLLRRGQPRSDPPA